ncbi:YdcF family protein [Catenulispora pinisilvae]|uniref:YdcF family protein n=1 Tax=Catenulispora pinisilvae TaxID=2705253 RepID=UPI001892185B|nr:YdcF family protein [Catenulispora pinisilvae]
MWPRPTGCVLFAYLLAALFALLFVDAVMRDPRGFRNAVFLGLTLSFLGLGLLVGVSRSSGDGRVLAVVAVGLLPTVGLMALVTFLILNGLTMLRKEGRTVTNLLSLACGVGIVGLVLFLVAAVVARRQVLIGLAAAAVLVVCYLAFLFFCYLSYGFVYRRMPIRRAADFVVVLGAGLMGGRVVSPLLASRLDRGRSVYESLDGDNGPMLIVSGGKGSDERLSEAEAMADYLVERGFPADRILKEDQSRTTEENLLYSAALMREMRPEGYRCVVVTNDFHSYRAALIARDLGVPAQVAGSPTAAYFLPSATIREFIAVFVRYWKVNLPICAFLAAPALVMLAR